MRYIDGFVSTVRKILGSLIVGSGGTVRYVSKSGNDNNNGLSPDVAFLTISAAIAASSAGDVIKVGAGTYAENITLNVVGLQIIFAPGSFLAPAAGVAITASANSSHVYGELWITGVAGSDCVDVSGSYVDIDNVYAIGGVNGFDVSGTGCKLVGCRAGQQTGSGFDITGSQGIYLDCSTVGIGATIGYNINGSASVGIIIDCTSTGHETAGFSISAGSTDWTIKDCSSGGDDGDYIDNGTNNMFANFVDQLTIEQHEHIYPYCTGQGVANDPITISNSTTDGAGGTRDDQNYWGDTTVVIPVSAITSVWSSVGIYIHATTVGDVQQWELYFTQTAYCAAQNGGNDWDKNETVLTVDDGSIFQNGDFVWITGSDKANGEIVKVSGAPAGNVVTIVRETTADGQAGLRYDYDITPANNKMYIVSREDEPALYSIQGDFSAGSARDFISYRWHESKELPGNTGAIMRMLNATDDLASTFDVRVIYED